MNEVQRGAWDANHSFERPLDASARVVQLLRAQEAVRGAGHVLYPSRPHTPLIQVPVHWLAYHVR